jgi:uncharacterized damage-inducible protein DinB
MKDDAMKAEQARTLAAYNRWMNERLYSVCAELPDAERKQDRGAFFRSIHGTLNHLLLADKIWLGRFRGEPFAVGSLADELHADFGALREDRARTDQDIEDWAAGLTDDALQGTLRFTSITRPTPSACDLWAAVTHFFNHQAHHRGQVTTLLSQCGKDYGVTDLLWLPDLVRPDA